MTAASTTVRRPTVSVVLPTLDEREHITDCLESLLRQDCDDIVEILVVDGGSSDGTRDIAAARGAKVRVLDNPRVSAAAAMNVGIAAARGDVICRADAHTLYEADYVSRCVAVLRETGAANVGGRMRPIGTTSFGRAVAAVTTSRFGVGPGRFHYADERCEVDTVYLGCWLRSTLQQVGGYDEHDLQWAAEDQELNLRLRESGASSCSTRASGPGTSRGRRPAASPVSTATTASPRPRRCASTAASRRGGRLLPRFSPPRPSPDCARADRPYGSRCPRCTRPRATAAWKLSDDPGVAPHRAFAALEICHWSYAVGLWTGLLRIARGRSFDAVPRGGR